MTRIEAALPGLRAAGYSQTSPADDRYNCIAWAAGATDRGWWPGDRAATYWLRYRRADVGLPPTAAVAAVPRTVSGPGPALKAVGYGGRLALVRDADR